MTKIFSLLARRVLALLTVIAILANSTPISFADAPTFSGATFDYETGVLEINGTDFVSIDNQGGFHGPNILLT